MKKPRDAAAEPLPPVPIRVETALSRYPVHRLAKHGTIAIDIRERNEDGEVSIKWEVTHNSKYGQPGPLAYKLDTLVINRRIEEAARPVPRTIRLGNLTEICQEIGLSDSGGNTNQVKKSLIQNALVGITAKIRYKRSDGMEQSLEAVFTRYNIVFTGEKLPNGHKADAVHIVLSDIYIQVINGAMTRPLDYDYLKGLPPAAQRFYELLSFQMYATLKNDRSRARLLYSELCRHAPLTRHFERERARSQLAKIHAPHKKSGYIARVEFQPTIGADDQPDWVLLYTPGPRALAEFQAFTRRGGPVPLLIAAESAPAPPPVASDPPSPLAAALMERGVTPAIARRLAAEYGNERVAAQLDVLDWHIAAKPGRIADPAAWLVRAIENGHAPPPGFVPRAERERRAAANQARRRAAAEAARRERERDERVQAEQRAIDAHWDALSEAERGALEAAALAQATPEEAAQARGRIKRFITKMLRDRYILARLRANGTLPPAED